MSNLRPSFPLQCLDIRNASYTADPHYLLVLKGSFSPLQGPLFSQGEAITSATVDVQGLWGSHEWSLLPQKLDPSCPWLAFIPIYHDSHHFTRFTIHTDMITQKEKDPTRKEAVQFQPSEKLKEKIREYVTGVTQEAEKSIEMLQGRGGIEELVDVVWPNEAIVRATYLSRLIVSGLPSRNSFKRAFTSMRRAVLELEGLHIWTAVLTSSPLRRMDTSASLKAEKKMSFRGAFLEGPVNQWLDAQSNLRRIYAHLAECNVPLYALVKQGDWNMQPIYALRTGGGPFVAGAQMEGT